MTPTGKCPKCGGIISYLKIEKIQARLTSTSSVYNAITYQCPSCFVILASSLDPISLAADTAATVVEALKKARV